MMNEKSTFFLVFVTLLALLLNLGFSLYIIEIWSILKIFNIQFAWLIGLIFFVAILGASASFVFSEMIARLMLGVTLIKQPSTYLEKWLFSSVERQSRQLGIVMPQIGVFYASDLNAFTTGRGQRHAMFAVSSGLLESLNQDELEAIIGHELAHIENGDMVSLAIARGIVVSLTELPARIFGLFIDAFLFRGRSQGGVAYTSVFWFCMLFMGLFPHFIVMWFSRQREFSADKISALLNGEDKMVAALQRLSGDSQHPLFRKQVTAFGFASTVLEGLVGDIGSIKNIFSSHPPLSKRIHVMQNELKLNNSHKKFI
ncbi:MAG: zinc metalloprotease HtpX [Gammaproteobacteria bacterium]|nr:zinc metalloprotease HtpX [Gammaproteobacteria bacterium]MCW8988449.1 zinc metalloprotease HtpX [Gammaproteobacteria bacterium]